MIVLAALASCWMSGFQARIVIAASRPRASTQAISPYETGPGPPRWLPWPKLHRGSVKAMRRNLRKSGEDNRSTSRAGFAICGLKRV